MKKITTTKIGRDFAESNFVLLHETPETLLFFKPEIHPGGVRGYLVRFKKERSKDWSQLGPSDFEKVTLSPNTKIELDMHTEAITRLCQTIEEHSKIIEQGIKSGRKEYVVAEKEKVIIVDDATKKVIFEKILQKGYTEEFWDLLEKSEPELATHLSVGHLYSEKIKILEELSYRLQGNYSETTGSDSWQRWIYKNNWLFGTNYIQVIEKTKISLAGSMPDYLFLTADSFADILEIKLPEEEVIVEDKGHAGAYKWCPKTNEAIGQVVNYLAAIDRLQTELEKEIRRVYGFSVSFVKPRGFILVGRKDGWNEFKKEALRNLNYSLHGIEVLTYTDLMQRGNEIAKMYKTT